MKTRDIKQTVRFRAKPHEIYAALMDSRKHSRFTGDRASISRKTGGKITAYDGYIEGKNLELEDDKKIVQLWRASDWPEGHFSKVSFIISGISEGSKLEFMQEGVPDEFYDSIQQGWIDFYWNPLKKMLEK